MLINYLLCLFFLFQTLSLDALSRSIDLPTGTINYEVDLGWLPTHLPNQQAAGKIFYISYHVPSDRPRPVTFCFNGGPGAAAVFLHMGAFGPKRLELPLLTDPILPVKIQDNIYTLLKTTDLVFVDPISTGFSRADSEETSKAFFSFQTDAHSLADFINNYMSSKKLHTSPLFLLGSSYATIRIVGVASELYKHFHMPVSGLIMISAFLNYQSINDPSFSNDFSYIFSFPTYAAAHWYHSLEVQKKLTVFQWTQKAQQWASTEYLDALWKGDQLTPKKREEIAHQFSTFTGIPVDLLIRERLRIQPGLFFKELLRDKQRTVGRFDVRYTGIDSDANRRLWFDYDPSYSLFGGIAAAFLEYLTQDLAFQPPEELSYYFLGKTGSWHYNEMGDHFLSVIRELQELLITQPYLQLFVASGIFDMALPYMVVHYDLEHLKVDASVHKDRIHRRLYLGGHMLYTDTTVLKDLSKDLEKFFSQLKKDSKPSSSEATHSSFALSEGYLDSRRRNE